MRRGRRMVGEREEEGEEEEVSLGVIMTNTEIFHICHIISLYNLPFFLIFHIIWQFNLGFFHIFLIFSLFNLPFFHIFPIFSLFNLLFYCIFQIFHYSTYFSSFLTHSLTQLTQWYSQHNKVLKFSCDLKFISKNSHCSKIYCVLQLFEKSIGQCVPVIRDKH